MTVKVDPRAIKVALATYTITHQLKVIPLHDVSIGACSCGDLKCGKNAGKHPRISNWRAEASSSFDRVFHRWWGKWPSANIGVPTGVGNGFFALDIDDVEALEGLLSDGREWPLTYSYQTGSGNRHYWFKYPESQDITNSRGSLPMGIDVRGEGGYLVVPPSVTAVGAYESAGPIQTPADAPQWLLDALRPVPGDSGTPLVEIDTVQSFDSFEEELRDKYRRYTQGVVASEILVLEELTDGSGTGRGWDNTTYGAACNLFELAKAPWSPLTEDEAENLIREHAPPFDDDGWNEARLERCIRSAYTKIFNTIGVRPLPELKTSPTTPAKTPSGNSNAKDRKERNGSREKDSGESGESGKSALKITLYSDIEDEIYEWYDRNWIPKRGCVLVAGYGGSGKSLLFAHWIRQITRGSWGGEPQTCIYLTREDSESAIIKPRLVMAGVDLSRVATLSIGVSDDFGSIKERAINFKHNVDLLREAVHELGAKVIFLDPGVSFLGIDEDRDSKDMQRTILEDLHKFAEEENLLIIVIKHYKKQQAGSEKLATSAKLYGSTVWYEVFRHVLGLRKIDDELKAKLGLDENDPLSAILHVDKNSYGPTNIPLKAFRFVEGNYKGDKENPVAKLESCGERVLSGEEIDARAVETDEQADRRIEGENSSDSWILKAIKDAGGVISRIKVLEMLENQPKSPSVRTIDRRVKKLESLGKITVQKISGNTNNMILWSLCDYVPGLTDPMADLDA